MKRLFLVLPLLALAAASARGADEPATNAAVALPAGVGLDEPMPIFDWDGEHDLMFITDEAVWAKIVMSRLVLVADIDVSLPPEDAPQDHYLSFPFVVRDVLKGSVRETNLVLKVWPKCGEEMVALKTSAPTNADDRLRLLFVSTERNGECYLDLFFKNGIQRADEADLAAVKREIAAQNRALDFFDELVRREDLPHWETVSNAVAELTTDADRQFAAVDRILDLGVKAVPALIVLMDDWRELPVKSVSLPNSAVDSWEAFRHYGTPAVGNLLDALADHATKIGFIGFPGETDLDRQEVVRRWKLLLLRWTEENKKAGRFLSPRLVGSESIKPNPATNDTP